MIYVRTFLFYLYISIATSLLGIICIVAPLLGDRNGRVWWPVSRAWAWMLMRIGGVTGVTVEGLEKLTALRSAVLMSNHQSHFDPPTLIVISKRVPLRFLTKHTLFYFPIFGLALHLMGHVFINRGDSAKARRSVERAAADITQGKVVFVFPEGTRARTEDLLPFKKGGFVIAIRGKVPIIPVGIAGTREVHPAGWLLRGTGPVVVVIGDPIAMDRYTLDTKGEAMAEVRTAILRLREQACGIRESLTGRANERVSPERPMA
jgi:1-acyl-sn-glycerol-3-phosphate acyltransferase